MSLENPNFLAFSEKIFKENSANYNTILNSLEEESQDKLKRFLHFYYFICRPELEKEEVREELIMVGITSLMEAMMQEIEYKDVFAYFESEYPKENIIVDFKKFKKEYLSKHGAARKVKKYFEKYFSDNDKKTLLSSIKIWDNNKNTFISLKNIKEFADLLYKMRSEFVHKAKMRNLNLPNTHFAAIAVDKNIFKIYLRIKEFMQIFEKSFVRYWKKI